MIQIVIGSTFIGLGLWGVVDEWYYLKDLISGAAPVAMILFGLIAIWVAIIGDNLETETTKRDNE